MGFKEQLAAAQAAPKPHRIIKVSLDSDLTERRDALIQQLTEAAKPAKDPRLAKKKTAADEIRTQIAELEAAEAASLVELKVTKAPGTEYSFISGKYPSTIADGIGYDIRKMTDEQGYRWITRRDGDNWVEFEYAPAVKARPGVKAAPEVNEFSDFCAVLGGSDVELISDTVFYLNDLEPRRRRERLGKASTPETEPSDSSSPPA